jgi:hypothetical protein
LGWKKKDRDNIRAVVQSADGNHGKRSISWGHLEAVLVAALGSAPDWLRDFHFEPVQNLVRHQVKVPMVDVEVFDSRHAFVLGGFRVHNSNNEFRLEAHRDVGIRPLLAEIQNFLNAKILPLLAPDLADTCHLKFVGLEADTAEKESVRLQQDQAVHMTMDQVLEQVEKDPVGMEWGGKFLLNPAWQQALFMHRTVGDIMEHWFGQKGASKDPRFAYIRDPMFFQWQQLLQQQQQLDQQAQQQQQQAQMQ